MENIKNFIKTVPPLKKSFQALRDIKREVELNFKRGEKIVTIEGLSARFIIETQSDLFRLREEFEGQYSKDIINTLKNLKGKGFVVNIGAAQGFYTVYSGLAGNNTLAIEPDPVTFNSLQKTIVLNNLIDKVECKECAIGDESGEQVLFTDGVRKSAPSFIKNEKKMDGVKVPILRMDEVVKKNPDVLIMDVEGYEGNVFRGMGELRPKEIFVEIHPAYLAKINQSEEFIRKILEEKGYEIVNQYKRGGEFHCHYSNS